MRVPVPLLTTVSCAGLRDRLTNNTATPRSTKMTATAAIAITMLDPDIESLLVIPSALTLVGEFDGISVVGTGTSVGAVDGVAEGEFRTTLVGSAVVTTVTITGACVCDNIGLAVAGFGVVLGAEDALLLELGEFEGTANADVEGVPVVGSMVGAADGCIVGLEVGGGASVTLNVG